MTPYLVIGRGRLSRHFQHYLGLESIEFEQWDRSSPEPVDAALERCEAALLLISDDAIERFLAQHGERRPVLWIHCSGCISTPRAEAAHPLMTFGDELYDLEDYRRVPFVCERGRRPFDELFPRLGNPHAAVDPERKALYHALCTLGGNFTTLLWQKVLGHSERALGIDRALFFPYLERVARNLTTGRATLTGPLARNDLGTIDRHLAALGEDPFAAVYRAFVAAYRSDRAVRSS
jgi:predicted short-subunit dehydrogenase-like oxidoreductase (DUF2520 family)